MPPTRPPQDAHERLYPAIAPALFLSAPGGWDHITLNIATTSAGQVQLEIMGPGGIPNLQLPDDSLYPQALALYDLFAAEARPFSACTFQLRRDAERAKWSYSAEFAYRPEA